MYIYIYIYTADTSGVNRLASQICHNRLFHKKLQQNLLHMISTEVSSLATHNSTHEDVVNPYLLLDTLESRRDCCAHAKQSY
jgi:predicted alpha/beta-fold hydrolase